THTYTHAHPLRKWMYRHTCRHTLNHASTCSHTHKHMFTHTHTHTHTHTNTPPHTHTPNHNHNHTHTHIHTHTKEKQAEKVHLPVIAHCGTQKCLSKCPNWASVD